MKWRDYKYFRAASVNYYLPPSKRKVEEEDWVDCEDDDNAQDLIEDDDVNSVNNLLDTEVYQIIPDVVDIKAESVLNGKYYATPLFYFIILF